MSEIEAWQECPNSNKLEIFLFSGSGRGGVCMHCGYQLPPETIWNQEGFISFTG
jgi:hypothetical protein